MWYQRPTTRLNAAPALPDEKTLKFNEVFVYSSMYAPLTLPKLKKALFAAGVAANLNQPIIVKLKTLGKFVVLLSDELLNLYAI